MLTTNPFDDDHLHEECGIFGGSGSDGAAALVALGLHALQHRGQEAAGITSYDGAHFHTKKAMGHVAGNFDSEPEIGSLPRSTPNPSISMTSIEPPPSGASPRHESHCPHGSGVGPCSQLRERARIRALEVLPQPRGPEKR